MSAQSDAVNTIFEIYKTLGTVQYSGEDINAIEHGLQCADTARANEAHPALIAASLLHDIGQLVDETQWDETGNRLVQDMGHEYTGAAFLAQWFGPDVTEPVRMHVDAKRYLTATNAEYFDTLSEDSKRTLGFQGGPFTDKEAEDFIAQPFAKDAVALRMWEDGAGKVVGAETSDLENYRELLESLVIMPTSRQTA